MRSALAQPRSAPTTRKGESSGRQPEPRGRRPNATNVRRTAMAEIEIYREIILPDS